MSPIVPFEEFARLLGYPAGERPEGPAHAAAERAREWFVAFGRPWSAVKQERIAGVDGEMVRLDGDGVLRSRTLAARLTAAKAHAVAVVAASAGPGAAAESARLWAEGLPDEAWLLDAYASAVVEQLVRDARLRLSRQSTFAIPPYSPGYAGWDMQDQFILYELFDGFPGPLEILESGMLRPEKSMLTLFGVTSQPPVRDRLDAPDCRGCADVKCGVRRKGRSR